MKKEPGRGQKIHYYGCFYMEMTIPNERLLQLLANESRAALESRQVALRLKKLLPTRLHDIKASYNTQYGASKAIRLALTDKAYQQAIDEYLKVQNHAVEARIQYETHFMLYQARRSLKYEPKRK